MSSALKSVRGIDPRSGQKRSTFGVTMEEVESRRLMTASVVSSESDSFSDISGGYFGTVLYGDNGYADGAATVEAGTGSLTNVKSYPIWDANTDDGIDSGDLSFSLTLNAGGTSGGTFSAGNSGVLSFASGSSGMIQHVAIQADVTGPYMQMTWQNLSVSFYRGGQLMETVAVSDVSAGTLDGTTYGPSEAITVVNANATDYDGVRVTGEVRLAAAEGVYPTMTDIFGKITIA